MEGRYRTVQPPTSYFVTISNFENPDIINNVFQKANIRLKIVIVKEIDGAWKLVDELPYNNPAYSVGHPAISVTGDTLFFASNIPDKGVGKTDLYMAVRNMRKWGKSVNLGDKVNSKENDMFPFFFKNNMLIFASNDRENGNGGLDLYYSCIVDEGFTTPQNIKEFNTSSDDFGLVIHDREEVGYFTSKRAGGKGDDDIYKVLFEKMTITQGKVVDNATNKTIPDALVVLYDCNGNKLAAINSDINGEFLFKTEPSDCLKIKASKKPYHDKEQKVETEYIVLRLEGDYTLELLVRDKNTLEPVANAFITFNDNVTLETGTDGLINRGLDANINYIAASELEGYMNESVSFTTVEQPYGLIKRTINVEKVKVGQKFTLDNIYYNFDKWDILPEAGTELNKLVKIMNDNQGWKVELGSHTDSRGNDSYNENLSQKRSDSAVNYIITMGISRDRIIAKGYGESQLINQCKNGIICSDAEHRQNRRTEFKILDL